MIERSYSYAILRYVHDPITAEFVNIGLLLFSPSQGGERPTVIGKVNRRIGRIRQLFPDVRRASFTTSADLIDRSLSRACASFSKADLFETSVKIDQVIRRVSPTDDSSIVWHAGGGGVSKDLRRTFDRLFDRYVTRYETRNHARRSDEEVWRPIRDLIREREIAVEFEPKTISGADDEIEFSHAWKNGVWHVYEPLSLDLADEDGILSKTRKWLGNLQSVSDTRERFVTHFIVGRPTDPALEPAFERAKKILLKSPGAVEVFEERDASTLVDNIAREWSEHRAAL